MAVTRHHPALTMFALIFAGEAIFSLPFHVTRYFRPTLLEVFALDNRRLGDVFALYGLLAMLSYFPGGLIADRVAPRHLLCVSLLGTAAGGLVLATIPGMRGLLLLYGAWGVTTILLFWAAMIRATRRLGGSAHQGAAFGLLDGGRGLVAAALATLAVALFSRAMPTDPTLATTADRTEALSLCILFYSAITAAAAIAVWLFVPPDMSVQEHRDPARMRLLVVSVIRRPVVWLKALIVVCAYCGYKGLDFYTIYVVDVLGFDEVASARFQAGTAYLRPVGAVAAGLLADRFSASGVSAAAFALLTASYAVLALATPAAPLGGIVVANLVVTFVAVFALRGIYFALIAETRIPRRATGTAVGVISAVGYLPDVFFAPVAGRLIDNIPGVLGYTAFFALLAVLAAGGLLAVVLLRRQRRHPAAAVPG